MIINCRYNPFILRRCDSLLFFLQWHRESTTICLLINWWCPWRSSFAIYYTVFALCQNAAQTHCIISELEDGAGAESVWWLQLKVRLPADNDTNANNDNNNNSNGCVMDISGLEGLSSSPLVLSLKGPVHPNHKKHIFSSFLVTSLHADSFISAQLR